MQSFSIKNDLSILSNYSSTSKVSKNESNNETVSQNESGAKDQNSKIVFGIEKYSPHCKEFAKIDQILSLSYDSSKCLLFLVGNPFSLFTLNFLLLLFPSLKLFFFFKKVPINNASYVAIFKNKNIYVVTLNRTFNNQITFSFMNFTYIYSDKSNSFISSDILFPSSYNNYDFLNDSYVLELQSLFSSSKSILCNFDFLLYSTNDMFYCFIILASIFYFYSESYFYGYCLLLLTAFSIILSYKESKKTLTSINNIINNDHSDILVFRKDYEGKLYQKKITSLHLVIGDMYEIPSEGNYIPYNTKLLSGSLIIKHNENIMLVNANDLLPKGAKVLQRRKDSNSKYIGIVEDLYVDGERDDLVNNHLFPLYGNYDWSYQMIIKTIIISGLFIISICLFVHILFAYNITYNPFNNYSKFCYAPFAFSFLGLLLSVFFPFYQKIEHKSKSIECNEQVKDSYSIHCIHPTKIGQNGEYEFENLGKNLNQFSEGVFDYYKSKRINDKVKSKNKELEEFFVENVATCHYITSINNNLICNDPIDLLLFKEADWIMYEPQPVNEIKLNYDSLISTYVRPKQEKDLQEKLNNQCNSKNKKQCEELYEEDAEDSIFKQHYEIGIVRHFHIEQANSLLSVIVRDVNEPFFKAYSKGNPNTIKSICKSETIPKNFSEIVSKYEKEEKKVIALSAKMMKMNYMQSQEVKRDFVEKNMIFLGFIVVEKNKGSNKEVIL